MGYETKSERYFLCDELGRCVLRGERAVLINAEEASNNLAREYLSLICKKYRLLVERKYFPMACESFRDGEVSTNRIDAFYVAQKITKTYEYGDCVSFVSSFCVHRGGEVQALEIEGAVICKEGFIPPPLKSLFKLEKNSGWAYDSMGRYVRYKILPSGRIICAK